MAAGKAVLIGACGLRQDLPPFIAIALALRRRGCAPVIAAVAAAAPDVRCEGLAFQPLRPSPHDAYADFDDRAYDLVFAPPQALAARALAEAQGRPWIEALTQPPLRPSPWRRLFPPPDPMRELRRALGLSAPVLPLRSLGLFSPTLVGPQALPPGTESCGFAFHDRPRSVSGELMDFLDAGAPPIVFTSSGTGRRNDDFFRISIAAAERLGRRAVLLVGDGAVLGTPPSANIGVFSGAPVEAVMPRAAAIVHQGGISTAAQALRSGKPMLVVPSGAEQRETALRCQSLGVARVVGRAAFTPRHAARWLAQILADEAMLRAAAALGRRITGEVGAARAADAIAGALSDGMLRSFG